MKNNNNNSDDCNEAEKCKRKLKLLKNAIRNRHYRWNLRLEVIKAYGSKCQCCGETNYEFLTIDHVDKITSLNDRKLGRGHKLYMHLKRKGWPKEGYRLLCYNCNCSIGNFGYCPHKNESKNKH